MLKRKRAREAVTETLKFGRDFIDAIVIRGDKAPALVSGGDFDVFLYLILFFARSVVF